MDFLECSLCNNQYNEGKRRARTLQCAHYFCQDCLEQVIKSGSPRCPTCRANIPPTTAEHLPPNFLMDELLSKMSAGKVSVDLEEDDDDFSAGSCQKHKRCKLYFTCQTHNLKVCRECTILEHSPSRCQIISFEDELKKTKNMTLENLEIQTQNRENNIQELKNLNINNKSMIHNQKSEVFLLQRKIKGLQDNISETEQEVKSCNEAIQDCVENKTKIEKIKKELTSSKTKKQINGSIQDAEDILKLSKSIEFSLKTNFKVNDQNYTSPDRMPLKLIQSRNEFIGKYLSYNVNGETRFAKLMIKNGDTHLPALSSCRIAPTSEMTLTVSALLSKHPNYPWTNEDVYFVLATEGEELGTVYVKLRDDLFSQYIRKLCLGTIGPCYRGAVFKGRGEYSLYTGDVTEYDSSRPSEVPRSLAKRDELKKGSVYIENETGLRFCISKQSNLYAMVIGNVINGFNVIETAWNFPKGEVKIKDVGIVLKK